MFRENCKSIISITLLVLVLIISRNLIDHDDLLKYWRKLEIVSFFLQRREDAKRNEKYIIEGETEFARNSRVWRSRFTAAKNPQVCRNWQPQLQKFSLSKLLLIRFPFTFRFLPRWDSDSLAYQASLDTFSHSFTSHGEGSEIFIKIARYRWNFVPQWIKKQKMEDSNVTHYGIGFRKHQLINPRGTAGRQTETFNISTEDMEELSG